MRVDELRTGLDDLAGPPVAAPAHGAQAAHRAVRRQRATHVGLGLCAAALVMVGGVFLLGSDHDSPHVTPADTVPTTTVEAPPPTFDGKALFDQPRIGVSDQSGKTRGTIPTAAYKAALGITADGSPPPQTRDNSPVPVLTDEGRTDGYWLPCYGFVERSVVEIANFDATAYCEKQNALDDADWLASMTPEERQQYEQQQREMLEEHGIQPPPSTQPITP